MSASLDKSLDDIISSTRKPRKVGQNRPAGRKVGGAANRVGKKVGGAKVSTKQPIVAFKRNKAAPSKPTAASQQPVVDLSYATKVVAQGLPRDIKQDGIRDFFQSQVGPVQNIALSYNEKGQFKGIATIIFKSSKSAALAVEKYNNAPIDGGSSKLKLELIVDPSKKPLASRIAANTVNAPVGNGKPKVKVNAAKTNQLKLKQKIQQKKKAPQPKTKKPVKRGKKTIEQLDQEMADYFDN